MAGDTPPPLENSHCKSALADERLQRKVEEFGRRFDHIVRSFRIGFEIQRDRPTFNESLEAIKKTLNPRTRKKPRRMLVDPAIEWGINTLAMKAARQRDPTASCPTQDEIDAAAALIVATVKPLPGRPKDYNLALHVQAFMALLRETLNVDLRDSRTRNSDYDRYIVGQWGDLLLATLHDIDPYVTMTQLANIVAVVRRSGAIAGKTFRDFFPLYGGLIDPSTGLPVPAPGYKLAKFEPVRPIYCS